MTISIEKLNERKTQLVEDFNTISKRIEDSEKELVTLRNTEMLWQERFNRATCLYKRNNLLKLQQ